MSARESVAACPLTARELPLLSLHRHVPERGLTELIEQSQRVGDPVRLSMFHLADCATCLPELLVGEELCLRGRRLLDACHGWRPRETTA